MNDSKKEKKRKVVIVGIDGLSHSLICSYMERGIMPAFAKMAAAGRFQKMKSTLPEISSVAWSSFMTGKNPAQHGIFGFIEIDPRTYDYQFTNFESLKEKPFWDGKKAVVINIPQTYPARPINGAMVSGFVSLDLKKATYPERLYTYLNTSGYRIDVNVQLARTNPAAFFDDLLDTFELRQRAIEHLYDTEQWDIFISTVTETDRLHHFFYESSLEGEYYHVFERFYRKLDTFVGRMFEKAQQAGALFLTCSDHGFTNINSEVYVNRWLIERGLLQIQGNKMAGIDPGSVCFCLDPSRIYIHLSGKYAKGRVDRARYEAVRAQVKEAFETLQVEGHSVVKNIYSKEEIFYGNESDKAPDLYILPNYGYDLKGTLEKTSVFGKSHFQGMHTYDDAHFYSSHKEVTLRNESIEGIASIVTEHLHA